MYTAHIRKINKKHNRP